MVSFEQRLRLSPGEADAAALGKEGGAGPAEAGLVYPAVAGTPIIEALVERKGATLPTESAQVTHAIQIVDRHGAAVNFEVRRPAGGDVAVPVLVILAGLKTGHRSLDTLPPCGTNALVAYAYPYDRERWRRQSDLGRAVVAWRMARRLSVQIEALLEWLRRQPWCDAERLSLCGGSLGAILLPMILRDLQSRGITVRRAVFAYGGAGRFSLAWLSLRRRSAALAALGALLAFACLRRIEPARHLPRLEGEFLVISSPDDDLVPKPCTARFEALLPEPKRIIHMTGEHLDTDRPDLIAAVVDATTSWLIERGAFNP